MQKLQHIGSIKDLRKIQQENTGKGSEEGGRKVRICPLLSSSFFLSFFRFFPYRCLHLSIRILSCRLWIILISSLHLVSVGAGKKRAWENAWHEHKWIQRIWHGTWERIKKFPGQQALYLALPNVNTNNEKLIFSLLCKLVENR